MRITRPNARTMLVGAGRRAALSAIVGILAATVIAAGPDSGPPDQAASDGAAYEIKYRLDPQAPLYYTIEHDITDSGAVPGWLSYSTTVSDRWWIIQTAGASAAPIASGPAASAPVGNGLRVLWECDRYEVRERGPKGTEVAYDSWRDLYPPPSLYSLGTHCGSRSSFFLDPATGRAAGPKFVPGPVEGAPTSRKPSRTISRCALSEKMLSDLLRDLGPLFIPEGPKRIGEQWTGTQTDVVDTFGTVTTKVTCTLRAVREVDGRSVATIELTGEMTLPSTPTTLPGKPASQPGASSAPTTAPHQAPASAPTATRPATSAPTASRPAGTTLPATATQSVGAAGDKPTQRPLELVTSLFSGSVEFDLSRGELIELKLRREMEGVTKIEQTKSDPLIPTEIRAGSSFSRRVRVSRTPPTRPIIVGGRKPPVIPPDELEAINAAAKPPTTRPAPTTRPSTLPATRPGGPATRPGVVQPGMTKPRPPHTTGPANGAGRLPGERPGSLRGQPTTRPVPKPSSTRPAAPPAGVRPTATQPTSRAATSP